MFTKRNFIKSLLLTAAVPFATKAKSIYEELPEAWTVDPSEDFWATVRKEYVLKTDYINLENGYFSMMSQPVLDAYLNHIKMVNKEASYYMRTVMVENKSKVRNQLAQMVGCEADELIITRNTTESLDTVISGIDWKKGDEVIVAEQDYGSMLDMFKQQARRYGIIVKVISIPLHPKTDAEIVELYEKAITPNTRLIMVSHMINITGHILPVKEICKMVSEKKGVEVMVDGAHALGHFEFKIKELNCDYYGSSLHKWLGTPIGAGILYVKKDKIRNLWPIYGDAGFADDNIMKLNHTGTHPPATDLAIQSAIEYHNKIGGKRKEERLRFLQEYWTQPLKEVKRVYINSPEDMGRKCGIANVGIEGISPADLSKTLLDKYKIWTVAIHVSNVQGVRITPHIYTTTEELDKLVKALKEIAASL